MLPNRTVVVSRWYRAELAAAGIQRSRQRCELSGPLAGSFSFGPKPTTPHDKDYGLMDTTSKCDRCGGVFSETDKYFRKNQAPCKTCGAAAHWERGADNDVWALNTPPETEYALTRTRTGKMRFRFVGKRGSLKPAPNEWWIGFGNGPDRRTQHQRVVRKVTRTATGIRDKELVIGFPFPCFGMLLSEHRFTVRQEVPIEFDTAGADGFRDEDGTWCSAHELLDGNLRNYGRKRVGTRESRGGEDTEAGEVAWYDLGGEAEKIDFLRAGGYQVRHEGTTGRPVGRPAKGILDVVELLKRIRDVLNTDDDLYERLQAVAHRNGWSADPIWTRRDLRQVREILAVCVPNLNTGTFARLFGVSDRAVRDILTSANSPNRGAIDMTLQTIDSRLGRIEAMLEEQKAALEENSAQVFQALYAFRYGETPVEAWERVLDEAD
jgi:hypothetical protein